MIDISASEATHITSNPRSGKLGTLNKDDDDDDDDVIIFITHIGSLFWCPYMNPQIFSFEVHYKLTWFEFRQCLNIFDYETQKKVQKTIRL